MTKCVFASLVALWLSPSPLFSQVTQEAGVPGQAIIASKTVAVVGAWGNRDEPGKLGKVVIGAAVASAAAAEAKGEPIEFSGSYEADAATAKQKVEGSIRKWGRYTVLEDPTKADLVLLVIVNSSRKFGQEILSNELVVLPGGGIPNEDSEPLWQSGDTKAAWGFAATKVTKKFQKYVEELEKKGKP